MMKVQFHRFMLCLLFLATMQGGFVKAQNKGEFSNLVCFLRFGDETNEEMFEKPISYYEQIFNDEIEGANSVYNYFKEASYGQLFWKSTFYPQAVGTQIIACQVKNPRDYYRAKSSINAIGYDDETDRAAREQALIKELAAYLSDNLPESTVIDCNNDGLLDNLCIIVCGRSEISNRYLLWPHRSDLALPDEKAIYIKGKKLVGYLMVFDDANGFESLQPIPVNTGVLCHEMSHTLGTFDLYHVNDNLNPVGVWDLMSDNLKVPQQMTAYTKWRYCKWLDEIPEISEPGRYTLNPVGGQSKERIAYKIKPLGSDEYFVVEYRKKEGTFDAGLPSSGLLVYRINPNYTGGNVNYNGTTRLDEQYIFRPGGSTTADGRIAEAAFCQENGRTAFGGTAEYKPFYSDGKEARFALTDISDCGETLSFTLEKTEERIFLSNAHVTLHGPAGSQMEITVEADVDWETGEVPEWLTVTPASGTAGKTTLTVRTNSANESAQIRTAQIRISGTEKPEVQSILTVDQSSNLLLPPSALEAQSTDEGILLTWTAPFEGQPVLTEDFENPENPNGWTITTTGNRNWQWQEAGKNTAAYEGSYSMYMPGAWDDIHQEENLISPTFAQGKTLTFYSKSIAPGKKNDAQFYYVEVSRDNGQNWTVVYDLKTDCSVVNQYTLVTIDLSEYMSDEMKIAFHAYDNNDMGLSYWWRIDNLNIYPEPDESLIKGYAVYRNGIRIGTADECRFTDTTPQEGEKRYTVRAIGDFGETSDSEEVVISHTSTGIIPADIAQVTTVCRNGQIIIRADKPLSQVRLFQANGRQVAQSLSANRTHVLNVPAASHGVYLLTYRTEGQERPATIKVVF